VSYLNLGEFFGEMGLFGEETRTANLVTRTPCVFAKISYDDFHAIRQHYPDVLDALTSQIGQRLKIQPANLPISRLLMFMGGSIAH
jgi:CRP/FNR family cyclic AMP-dependent transcriptional regulator